MENINSLSDQDIRELASRLAEVRGTVQQSGSAFSGALSDFNQASASAEESAYKISQGLSGVGQGAIQFTKALVDSKSDLTKYSAGVEAVTNGIGDIAGAFGPLGLIFGALIKVVGKITSEVLAENQVYLDAYDSLANFSGATAQTAEELKKTSLSAESISQYTLPGLVKVTNTLGTSLMSMGTTAGAAQKAFMKMADLKREEINEFSRLGITQEALNQLQADYIKQQSKLGIANLKDQKNLKDKSLAYAASLTVLSALTGKSTDQIQQERDRDQMDYKYAATLREEEEAGRDKVVNNMKNTVTRFRGLFDETLTGGLREVFATGLAQSTEGGKALYITTGGAIVDWARQVKEGSMTQEDFLKKVVDSRAAYMKANSFAVKASTELQAVTVASAENQSAYSKEIGDIAKVEKDTTNRMKTTTGTLVEQRIAGNDATAAMQKAFEAFIQLVAGPVNTAFTALLNGLKALAQGFIKQLSRLGILPGELEFMVMSYSELSEKQAELTRDIAASSRLIREDSPLLNLPLGESGETFGDAERIALASNTRRLAALEKVKAGMAPPAAAPAASAPAPAAPAAAGAPAAASSPAAAAVAAPKPPETIRIGSRQGFAKGGITDGPMSGHLGMMHDLEAVVPLPDGKTIPVKLNIPQLSEKQKNPLLDTGNLAALIESYTKALTKTTGMSTQTNILQESQTDLSFIGVIADRMETLITSMKTNTSLQSELLYYVKR